MNEYETVKQYKHLSNMGHFAASFKYIEPYVKDKRVLDLGCGDGVYLDKFSRDSVGIDASIPNLEKLATQGLHGISADLNTTLPFDPQSFDVVFCSHLLEHVDAPINLIRESYRILKNEGLIIIAVPLEKSLTRILLRDHYFRGHQTHLYSFSLDCIKQLFDLASFDFIKGFVDIPGVRRFNAIWMMDILQFIPFGFTRLVGSAFWAIGKKRNE